MEVMKTVLKRREIVGAMYGGGERVLKRSEIFGAKYGGGEDGFEDP